jgi:uncharacterized protein YegJ (DUF2314 family)
MRSVISSLMLVLVAFAWAPIAAAEEKPAPAAGKAAPVKSAPAKPSSAAPLKPGPKAMDAAIAKARGSIDEFWRQHTKTDPGVEHLALKVRVASGKAKELLWLIEIERKGAVLSGVINTDPVVLKGVKFGQRTAFKDGDIVDWTFMRNGKIVGNETLRALLDMMPAEDAAKYRGMFEKP